MQNLPIGAYTKNGRTKTRPRISAVLKGGTRCGDALDKCGTAPTSADSTPKADSPAGISPTHTHTHLRYSAHPHRAEYRKRTPPTVIMPATVGAKPSDT
ncbi:MAG TPA: hypothetical protein PK299_11420 [Anaerolineales bacterium]|nr:hypothetical protein [Anaerolineales bacterium]